MNNSAIHLKTDEAELFIPIYDKITVITGDSATGKTKMMKFLEACKKAKKNSVNIESSVDIDDIKLVNNDYTAQLMVDTQESDKIIFIDRTNTILSDALLEFIKKSKNLFILIGHRNISELTSQDAVLNMICDGNNYKCEQIYKNGILNPTERI